MAESIILLGQEAKGEGVVVVEEEKVVVRDRAALGGGRPISST
jgi:hypothetical protein